MTTVRGDVEQLNTDQQTRHDALMAALGFPNEADEWASLESVQQAIYYELDHYMLPRIASIQTYLSDMLGYIFDGDNSVLGLLTSINNKLDALTTGGTGALTSDVFNTGISDIITAITNNSYAVAHLQGALAALLCPCDSSQPTLPPPQTGANSDTDEYRCQLAQYYTFWYHEFINTFYQGVKIGVPVALTTIVEYQKAVAPEGHTYGATGAVDGVAYTSVAIVSQSLNQLINTQGSDVLDTIRTQFNQSEVQAAIRQALYNNTYYGAAIAALDSIFHDAGLFSNRFGDALIELIQPFVLDYYQGPVEDASSYDGSACLDPFLPLVATEGDPCVFVAGGVLQSSGNARTWEAVDLPDGVSATNNFDPATWEADCPAFLTGSFADYVYRAIGGGSLNNCWLITAGGDGHVFTLSTSYMNLEDVASDPVAVIFAGSDSEHASVEMSLPV